jgi:hypothetical protein
VLALDDEKSRAEGLAEVDAVITELAR